MSDQEEGAVEGANAETLNTSDAKLNKAFDFAWSWFAYHAKQRTDVFNYFIVLTGILGSIYGSFVNYKHPELCPVVAACGFILAVGFLLLDIRNKQLVDKATRILYTIQENEAFRPANLPKDFLKLADNPESPSVSFEGLNRHTFVFTYIISLTATIWAKLSFSLISQLWTQIKRDGPKQHIFELLVPLVPFGIALGRQYMPAINNRLHKPKR